MPASSSSPAQPACGAWGPGSQHPKRLWVSGVAPPSCFQLSPSPGAMACAEPAANGRHRAGRLSPECSLVHASKAGSSRQRAHSAPLPQPGDQQGPEAAGEPCTLRTRDSSLRYLRTLSVLPLAPPSPGQACPGCLMLACLHASLHQLQPALAFIPLPGGGRPGLTQLQCHLFSNATRCCCAENVTGLGLQKPSAPEQPCICCFPFPCKTGLFLQMPTGIFLMAGDVFKYRRRCDLTVTSKAQLGWFCFCLSLSGH